MAIAVIGGVITSTFLTLFVVPLVFAAAEKLTPPRFRVGGKKEAPARAAEVSAAPATHGPGLPAAARTAEAGL
jgi:hydrophobic/amphiphilic exporter-1 (mainly G- bacteria), HAE1 family